MRSISFIGLKWLLYKKSRPKNESFSLKINSICCTFSIFDSLAYYDIINNFLSSYSNIFINKVVVEYVKQFVAKMIRTVNVNNQSNLCLKNSFNMLWSFSSSLSLTAGFKYFFQSSESVLPLPKNYKKSYQYYMQIKLAKFAQKYAL